MLLQINKDMLFSIMQYLSAEDWSKLSLVNKETYKLCHDFVHREALLQITQTVISSQKILHELIRKLSNDPQKSNQNLVKELQLFAKLSAIILNQYPKSAVQLNKKVRGHLMEIMAGIGLLIFFSGLTWKLGENLYELTETQINYPGMDNSQNHSIFLICDENNPNKTELTNCQLFLEEMWSPLSLIYTVGKMVLWLCGPIGIGVVPAFGFERIRMLIDTLKDQYKNNNPYIGSLPDNLYTEIDKNIVGEPRVSRVLKINSEKIQNDLKSYDKLHKVSLEPEFENYKEELKHSIKLKDNPYLIFSSNARYPSRPRIQDHPNVNSCGIL